MRKIQSAVKGSLLLGIFLSAALSSSAMAQEVRYSWLDMSYMAQDAGIVGTRLSPDAETVNVNGKDGNGIRFRGSSGTWHNLYMFIDFGSTDIDVSALVINPSGEEFSADDEFDYTTIKAGLGLRYPIGLGPATDIYAEITYDSIDLDFGSFSGESFDTDNQDVGGALGVRAMLNDDFELRAYGRYTNHEDVDLVSGEFDAGAVFGAGFGWQIVRGFSIVGDYETGQFSNLSIGFRLDLDED